MNKKCVKRRKEAAWKATNDVRYILNILDLQYVMYMSNENTSSERLAIAENIKANMDLIERETGVTIKHRTVDGYKEAKKETKRIGSIVSRAIARPIRLDTKETYICDPEKNTECKKTCCQTMCFETTDPRYRKEVENNG